MAGAPEYARAIQPSDDHALIASAQAGDRAALDTLLRRHYDRIHLLCHRLVGSDSEADDAAQEALLAIVRGLPRFDGRAAFSTWAYRVTTNACLDELRRRRRRPVPGLPDDRSPEHSADGPRHETADEGAPPIDQQVTDRMDVDAALASLPPEFRAPVVLRDLCQLDYAEIADVLGIPPGTVRSRIARGRAALVPRLRGNPDPSTERRTS